MCLGRSLFLSTHSPTRAAQLRSPRDPANFWCRQREPTGQSRLSAHSHSLTCGPSLSVIHATCTLTHLQAGPNPQCSLRMLRMHTATSTWDLPVSASFVNRPANSARTVEAVVARQLRSPRPGHKNPVLWAISFPPLHPSAL